jgi:transcription antitermination factor NusG
VNTTLDLGSWCILRTSSADTLRLLKSLTQAGLGAWTPIEKRFGKMPRTKASFDKEAALLPTYVFGRVEHVDELLRLAMIPHRQHPKFWVFQQQGGIPLIADDQLNALRQEEDRKVRVFERFKRRGRKGAPLPRGTEVKLSEGPMAGFPGVVEDQQGQFTNVSFEIFGKPVSIKVASLLLAENMAQDELPQTRAA